MARHSLTGEGIHIDVNTASEATVVPVIDTNTDLSVKTLLTGQTATIGTTLTANTKVSSPHIDTMNVTASGAVVGATVWATGLLRATGSTSISGALAVQGLSATSVTSSGNITASSGTVSSSAVTAHDVTAVTLTSTDAHAQSSDITGNETVGGNFSVGGTTTLGTVNAGTVNASLLSGNTLNTGTAVVLEDITANRVIANTFSGPIAAAQIAGALSSLAVTGTSVLSGATTCGSTLSVVGNQTVGGTSQVTGTSTTGSLNVTNAASFNGSATFNGAVSTNSTVNSSSINVTNALTAGSVTSSGTMTVNGTATHSNNIVFADVGTGKRGIQWTAGGNDYAYVGVGATATNAGYLELATGDDGNEPIYVSQYNSSYSMPPSGNIVRRLTLLDGNGNSNFPGGLWVGTNQAANNVALSIQNSGKIEMNDSKIYLRGAGDSWHQISYDGTRDGPKLYGNGGFTLCNNSGEQLYANGNTVYVNNNLSIQGLPVGNSSKAWADYSFGPISVSSGSTTQVNAFSQITNTNTNIFVWDNGAMDATPGLLNYSGRDLFVNLCYDIHYVNSNNGWRTAYMYFASDTSYHMGRTSLWTQGDTYQSGTCMTKWPSGQNLYLGVYVDGGTTTVSGRIQMCCM